MTRRLLVLVGTVLATAVLMVALLPAGSVLAQASRTWVSGVGDDANPCSRTAPCKTLAGAISKTMAGGEINCLDPGGFGGVTITKSLTIKCQYTEGGVLVSGTNAIIINAAATDKVTLRGLDVFGVGTGAPTSLVGIKILSARTVHIIDTEVYRFQDGIVVAPTSAQTRVLVESSHIHNNGLGIIVGPGSGANTTGSFVTVRHSIIADNGCNAVASSFGTNASTPNFALDCGAGTSGTGLNLPAEISLYDSAISDATIKGVFARGSLGVARLGSNNINGNVVGLSVQDGGTTRSNVDNDIDGNGTTTPPTVNVPTT